MTGLAQDDKVVQTVLVVYPLYKVGLWCNVVGVEGLRRAALETLVDKEPFVVPAFF